MSGLARDFFVSGGTLPLDSASYIERSADRDLYENLMAGRYCYVLNSRQMGKSSLSVRTMARLKESGVRTAFIDLTQIGGKNVLVNQWYAGLTLEVGRAFGLESQTLVRFKEMGELSPMQRFFRSIREVVLEQIQQPIVIFVDEIDSTRNLPFDTDEFFAGIRECFNRRVQDENCKRLTFCLIGVAVPNELIRDPSTTPFNIGERVSLLDFGLTEIQKFGSALGTNGKQLTERVHYWTNGQPFLTQSLCREIASDPTIQDSGAVDSLVDRLFFGPQAVDTNLNLADVANRVLSESATIGDRDQFRANVLSAYEKTWRGGTIKDDEANRISVVLKLSGVLRPEGDRLVIRNRIYRRVFDKAWIAANMPGQELIRQRQFFRRGLIRGVAIAAVLGGVIGTLALLAVNARHEAVVARSALDYELYVSDMTSLGLFEGTGDSVRMASILARSHSNSHRGFEWNFWLGRLHDSPEEYTLDYSTPGKLEEGILSQDGAEICVKDRLANVAVVVDRRSKRVLGSDILELKSVVATKLGIVIFDTNEWPCPVKNIATGKVVARIGTPGFRVDQITCRDQADVALANEVDTADPAHQVLSVWNLTTGKCVFRHSPLKNSLPRPHAISKDGTRIVYGVPHPEAGSKRGALPFRLVVWDTASNREVDSIPYSNNSDFADISESGRIIAYWDERHLAKLRDVAKRQTIYSARGTAEDVAIAIQTSNDDRSAVFIASNGIASLREIPSGQLIAQKTNLWRLAPTTNGSVWVGSSSSVRVLDLSKGGQAIVGSAQKVARDGLGALRLTSQGNKTVARLGDPTLNRLPSFEMPPGAVHMTYNGLWCSSDESQEKNQLFSIGTKSTISLPFHPENIALGLQPNPFAVMKSGGTWYGISGTAGTVLWSKLFKPAFRGMWMAPDCHRLIASTWDGRIASIDPRTGNQLRMTGAHHLLLSSLNFSRDGRQFVTGGGDGLAILWDTDTLKKLAEFRGNAAQEVEAADISPDGKRVATCNVTGAWQIWDARTGIELTEFRASSLPLRSITFTSDARNLVTSGDDNIVRRWNTLDRDPTIRVPVPPEALKNVQFR